MKEARKTYRERVLRYEMKGLTTSDAQAAVDAEIKADVPYPHPDRLSGQDQSELYEKGRSRGGAVVLLDAERWLRESRDRTFAVNRFDTRENALESIKDLKTSGCVVEVASMYHNYSDTLIVTCPNAETTIRALEKIAAMRLDELNRLNKYKYRAWWD